MSNENDLIGFLVERLNHLEDLLVSSLLWFLLTGSFTAFAAIYGLGSTRQDARSSETENAGKSGVSSAEPFGLPSARQLFFGANVLLALLSGYYYFMLAQFYAAVVVLTPLLDHVPSAQHLWRTLQVPFLGLASTTVANGLILASAPLLPLLFSIFALRAWSASPVTKT